MREDGPDGRGGQRRQEHFFGIGTALLAAEQNLNITSSPSSSFFSLLPCLLLLLLAPCGDDDDLDK